MRPDLATEEAATKQQSLAEYVKWDILVWTHTQRNTTKEYKRFSHFVERCGYRLWAKLYLFEGIVFSGKFYILFDSSLAAADTFCLSRQQNFLKIDKLLF